jgi:MFS family permease
VWGTVGWIVLSYAFSYLWLRGTPEGGPSRLPHTLLVAAVGSVLMSAYCLTLPVANISSRARASLIPTAALRLLRRPDMALLCLVNFLVFVVYMYYYVGAAPYLKAIGLPEQHIMPAMTLGQLSEVAVMWTVAWVTRRLGYRRMFAVGIVAEVFRFGLFALGGSVWVALLGTTGHGFSIAYFMMASVMYLDSHSTAESRSGAQLLFMIITFGLAALVGSYIAGWTMDAATGADSVVNYRVFWSVPMWIALGALGVMLLFFRSREAE